MLECEAFSRDVFTKIIKSFIKDQLLPKIKKIVEQYINQLKLMQVVSKRQLEVFLEHINSQIVKELFLKDQEKVKQYELYMAEDNLSNDSLDPDCQDNFFSLGREFEPQNKYSREPQPWIIECLIELLVKESQIGGTLLGSFLKNELMDLLESTYFKQSM